MTVLSLVSGSDPVLFEELPRFDFQNPPADPIELARDLTETMLAKKGLGLAANQVGWRHRLCVISANPVLAMFNPRIVHESEEKTALDEGCLSFPGMIIKIDRPKEIRVRYTMPNGETVTNKYTGMTARIIHHEIDHLNGIVFTKRATKLRLAMAKGKQKARI